MKVPRRIVPLAIAALAVLGAVPVTANATSVSFGRWTPLVSVPAPSGDAAGQYIVTFKDGAPSAPSNVSSLAQKLVGGNGGHVQAAYTALGMASASLSPAAAERLRHDPSVTAVEKDGIAKADAVQLNPIWGLDRIDERNLPLDHQYAYPNSGTGVTAYIIDTGVRVTHDQFGGRASYGYDFIGNDPIASDCHGHGTHVAGTVGSSRYGVAKNVKIVAVRVLGCEGTGTYSQIIAGVNWVTLHHTARAVATMSLGGSVSSSLNDAVTRSIRSGVTYAVAAGNDNTDACTKSPASTPAAITVGNATAADARYAGTHGSNYGTCLDIWAPGTSILSTFNSSNTATATLTGTSMATPHVAGAAALVLAAHPTWTPGQIRNYLVSYATLNHLSGIGSGSPNRLLYVVH